MAPPLYQQSSTRRLTSSLSSASRGRRPRWLGFGVPARGSQSGWVSRRGAANFRTQALSSGRRIWGVVLWPVDTMGRRGRGGRGYRRGVQTGCAGLYLGWGVIRPVGMPGCMCWEIASDSLRGAETPFRALGMLSVFGPGMPLSRAASLILA